MIDQQSVETGGVVVAKAAQYGGAAGALIFGLSPGEWQAIGVIGGLLVGLGGFLLAWYYKAQHLKVAKERAFAWTPLSDE
jgi:hypothetical protein